MKKAILIPKIFKDSYATVGRYMPFFQEVSCLYGFEIIFCDDFSDNSYDMLLVFKAPMKGYETLMHSVTHISKDTKLILYLTDIHESNDITSHKNTLFTANMIAMMGRADMILNPYPTPFSYAWPDFVNKMIPFQHFYDPDIFDSINFNIRPASTCAVAGQIYEDYYPIRSEIAKIEDDRLKRIPILNGREYALALNKCRYSFVTPSTLGYTVAKYYESLAAGCMLLCIETKDMEKFGFIHNLNCFSISHKNIFTVIDDFNNNLDYCDGVRLAGFQYARENFSATKAAEGFAECLQ